MSHLIKVVVTAMSVGNALSCGGITAVSPVQPLLKSSQLTLDEEESLCEPTVKPMNEQLPLDEFCAFCTRLLTFCCVDPDMLIVMPTPYAM